MKTFRSALLIVLLALLSAGCYTLLKHPGGTRYLDYDRGGSNHYRDCRDCHSDYHFYHPTRSRFSPYYGSYYRPWWYDDYWFYGPYSPGYWPDGSGGGSPAPAGSWIENRRHKRSGSDDPLVRQIPDASPPGAPAGDSPAQAQDSDGQNSNESSKPEEKKPEKEPRKKKRHKR